MTIAAVRHEQLGNRYVNLLSVKRSRQSQFATTLPKETR